MTELVLDEERRDALLLMEGAGNVFLTGKAGSGKSSLSKHFLDTTKKKVLVLGSTGIAAINVGGQTIHSALRIMPGMQPKDMQKRFERWVQLFKYIDTIMCDELSMVRADLLDCMDRFLRLNGKDAKAPFGGIQLIGVGDICQLPPVVTDEEMKFFADNYAGPYFFNAHVYPSLEMNYVELKRVFRQKDEALVRVLNLIRTGEATRNDLLLLNTRYAPSFDGAQYPNHIYLAPHNNVVDEMNATKIRELSGKEERFGATVVGKFTQSRFPAEQSLVLKSGARVMLLNNDRDKRWVNGDIGTVVSFSGGQIDVELSGKRGVVSVSTHTWENTRQVYDATTKSLTREVVGSYSQFPVRLAWAMTIHKSQGQTFDNVVVDFDGGTFAHGQAYVGLSRSTSLAGLVLTKKLKRKDVIFDERIRAFIKSSGKVT